MSKTAPLRTRLAAEDRRRQLIEVALELFSRNGFGGTTTKAIAAAAGVSEAIIFRHFATKEDLYTAILERKAEEGGKQEWLAELSRCAEARDDEGLFRTLITKVFEAYRRDPSFQRLMLYASLEGHDLAKISDRTVNIPVFEFLSAYVAKRQQEGAFRNCEPGVIILAAAGMAVHYATTTALLGKRLLHSSDEEVAAAFANLILDGVKKPSHGGGENGD